MKLYPYLSFLVFPRTLFIVIQTFGPITYGCKFSGFCRGAGTGLRTSGISCGVVWEPGTKDSGQAIGLVFKDHSKAA